MVGMGWGGFGVSVGAALSFPKLEGPKVRGLEQCKGQGAPRSRVSVWGVPRAEMFSKGYSKQLNRMCFMSISQPEQAKEGKENICARDDEVWGFIIVARIHLHH